MDRKKWLVVIAVDLAMALAALDSTVIGTAMPTVVASLGGLSLFSWVFSIYLLTSTVALPIFGRLSDLFGRRNMFVVAVWIFTGASALCGLATSMVFLIAARALQGIGAGGVFALSQAVFGEIFPPHERGKMQGYLAAVWGISALVGPLIGGLIVQYLGWRWTFFVNVPVGIAANYMLVIGLTGLASEGTRRRIDYAGAACLVVSIVALMLALLEIGKVGQRARVEAIAGLAVCLVFTAAFLAIESRVLRIPWLVPPLVGAGSVVLIYLLGKRVYASSTVGLIAAALLLFSPFFQMTASNFMSHNTTAFVILTCLYLWTLPTKHRFPAMFFSGIFLGLGMGVVTVTTVVAVQSATPPDQIGVVSTLPFFFRNIGATIGVAVMGTILNAHMTGAGTGPLALAAGEGAFRGMPGPFRGQLAAGIRAAFVFGLSAVALGVPVSFLVPDLSPARLGNEADTRKAPSTAPIE
ncbi:MAG: MFS transporter [candidate division NC10 bacterium]|nr:MFS transporter [candidate division NC10 bacterium]